MKDGSGWVMLQGTSNGVVVHCGDFNRLIQVTDIVDCMIGTDRFRSMFCGYVSKASCTTLNGDARILCISLGAMYGEIVARSVS